MDFALKPHWLAVLAASAAVTIPPAQPAGTLADLHGLSPRQVQSAAFSLASPQDLQIEATGAEPTGYRGTVTKIRKMWNGGEGANPWPGNAWILDLTTRKVVWELSTASSTSGSPTARVFNGSVRLPEGSYAAYYAAFPDGEYWTDDDGKPQSRKWHWFGDERIEDFKLIVRGNGQRLGTAEVERLRQANAASAVVALRAASARAVPADRILVVEAHGRRNPRRRRSPRGRRIRLRLDHQRRHARENLEADVARLDAGRGGRQEPRGGAQPDAAGRTVRGLLRDRRHARPF